MFKCIQYFDTITLAVVYAVPLGMFYCFRVKVFQVGMSAVHCILCLDAAGNINMNEEMKGRLQVVYNL